jgi:ADP-ribose pyrophosphatase YjhB (NUDIX family)
MSRTYNCRTGCCQIQVAEYKSNSSFYTRRKVPCVKAGVFIYDPEKEAVLLIQSRGLLWGCPKGSLEIEKDASTLDCAIREVKEETGLDILGDKFTRIANIKNRAVYYYMEMKTCDVLVQSQEDNDANGITWIKISCLEECINDGLIALNQHAIYVFKKFIDKTFPKAEFKLVESFRKRL